MEDQDIRQLLERAGRRVETTAPPDLLLMVQPAARGERISRTRVIVVAAFAVTMALVVGAALLSGGPNSSKGAPGSTKKPDDSLTYAQATLALNTAQRQARLDGAEEVSKVSAILKNGTFTKTDAGTDGPCLSGQYLEVYAFADFGLNGHLSIPGTTTSLPIPAERYRVDATTGAICDIAGLTPGAVSRIDPDAQVLLPK